jgi:hypothetical protein
MSMALLFQYFYSFKEKERERGKEGKRERGKEGKRERGGVNKFLKIELH